MKWIERIVMVLMVVALAWCWSGMLGCTAIFAFQLNDNDKGKDRYTLPPERVTPDGEVKQRNRMEIHVTTSPQLGLDVSGEKPSIEVEVPAETDANPKKGSGDKDKPTTRPAAEAAREGPGNID